MKFNILGILILALGLFISSCKQGDNKLPSGYEYTVIQEGSGESPKPTEYVVFGIKIMGDDGSVIQEMQNENMPSIQIPAEMPTGKEANAIIELLARSKVGGKYSLNMPIDSIPGVPEDMKKMKYITYEVLIDKILNEEAYATYMEDKNKAQEAKIAETMQQLPAVEELVKTTLLDYKDGKLQTETLPSGLKYHIISQGEGEVAAENNTVTANYYGTLMDGTKFDDSFSRGQAFPFKLGTGMVIKGWDQGFAKLNKGAKAFLFIPSNLAYGEAGSPPLIAGNSDLVFYVEVLDIQR